ncbi:hypothetical protein ACFSCX_07180 [Bacillus salitolerans]|uniref:Uncharacterized protein n=1 Tax=Bacillus salitolerans TaxID=1437434 RepID=A0ABW4LNK7_9BACI
MLFTIVLYTLVYVLMVQQSYNENEQKTIKRSIFRELQDGWNDFKSNKVLVHMTIYVIILYCAMTVFTTTVIIIGTIELHTLKRLKMSKRTPLRDISVVKIARLFQVENGHYVLLE